MENIGKKLKAERTKRNLSIKQVSDDTKIRPHIIEAIEIENFSIMPEVYVKAFVKTYSKYLDIDVDFSQLTTEQTKPSAKTAAPDKSEKKVVPPTIIFSDTTVETHEEIISAPIEPKPERAKIIYDDLVAPDPIAKSVPAPEPKKIEKKSVKRKKIELSPSNQVNDTDYTEIFKQKRIKNGINPAVVNYLLYAGVALVLMVVIYFTFFFNSNMFETAKNAGEKADTTVVGEDKGLLSYFTNSDSLALSAKALDTAWIKVECDGLSSEELVMMPGMEKEWSASEYFTVSIGNIGGIQLFRNGTQLPNFGKRGTVVKNVKITKADVTTQEPWKDDETQQIQSNNQPLPETKRYKRKKQEKPVEQPIKIIEKSPDVPVRPAFKR